MNAMKPQWTGTGELKSCSVAELPKRKEGCISPWFLYLCNFGFILLLCSLQGFKVVSGTVVVHKLSSSLRDTRLERWREESPQSSPAAKTAKPPRKKPSQLPHSAHARTLPGSSTQAAQRRSPGSHCGKHHFRGSTSGWEKRHQREVKGSSQQAPPLGDMCFQNFSSTAS